MVHVVDLDIPQEYDRILQKDSSTMGRGLPHSCSVNDSEHAHLQLYTMYSLEK